MNETAYWIWLLKTLGAAAPIRDILDYFGSPRKLYEAGSTEWRLSGLMSPKQIYALTRFSPSESGETMKICRENGWQILTPEHVCYPQALLELRNYPPVLFVWGNAEALTKNVKIAVVGTRKTSRYGARVAFLLSEALTKSGALIVSGGALGVDSAAHHGALAGGGKTIAVLGCGLGTDYLRENAPMRAQIAKSGGAVISEFLPFSPASRTTFPLRNRIISAISLGTVVVEAGERSGSLITARCALEQGRDVFAVPGDLISTAYTGGNKLIKDGAKPVFSPLDILEEYLYLYGDELDPEPSKKTFGELLSDHKNEIRLSQKKMPLAAKEPVKPKKEKQMPEAVPKQRAPEEVPRATEAESIPAELSGDAVAVYKALLGGEKHIDELCEILNLPVQKALSALTTLELMGYAELLEGKKYKLN